MAAKLRPGNVSSADDWEELLVPEIDRQQAEGQRVAFRADAAFARPAIYEALEARGVQYAIRIPANKNLELAIEDLLCRSPGRPSLKPLIRYKSFQYQADSWTTPRRVVAKVEHHVGELFPRVGFIVTNLPIHNCAVVRFYNKRGTAEQWIKEGKQATHWTRLSCHRFRANEVRLQLSVLAYNLGNLWRRLVLPTRIERWSLTSLQQRLVKTGGRLVKHALLRPRVFLAISEFPKGRKHLISLSFRGKASVRPAQVGGFDVNIVIHGSTAVRGRGDLVAYRWALWKLTAPWTHRTRPPHLGKRCAFPTSFHRAFPIKSFTKNPERPQNSVGKPG